jgi:hypothetical protein
VDSWRSAGSVPADPVATVLDLLRRAGVALDAGQVKQALRAAGWAEVDRVWALAQRKVRSHGHVIVEGGYRYRWVDHPVEQDESGEVAQRDGRAGVGVPAARPQPAVEIPLVRAFAALAIEVEELAVNEASARVVLHRVRAHARRLGLEPIGHAGESSTMDRMWHEPVGRPIPDGTPVVVVRPGYRWTSTNGDLLLARAVVQDRGPARHEVDIPAGTSRG